MSVLPYRTIRTSAEYDTLLDALYRKVKARVVEVHVPSVKVIAVRGTEPPASSQYQQAISAIYGIGYTLKMGLSFGKIRAPKRWFDYRVGALETLWWSTGKTFCVSDPKTLRWQAFLMVPDFVSGTLFDVAREQARAKHPDVPFEQVSLEALDACRAVQVLHVGPWSEEQASIDRLQTYVDEQRLAITGRHHEIYLSDPRRTAPARLKTVIRFPVR
jgi:hypothetical protein